MKSTLLILGSFIGLLASSGHSSEKPILYNREQDSVQKSKNQKLRFADKSRLTDSLAAVYTVSHIGSIPVKDTIKPKTQIYKSKVVVSYYADKFNGRRTASGQIYNSKKLTAAHKTLAFGTKLRVTNLSNNKSIEVVVNDRGPFSKGKELDVSKSAFLELAENVNSGIIQASIEIVN